MMAKWETIYSMDGETTHYLSKQSKWTVPPDNKNKQTLIPAKNAKSEFNYEESLDKPKLRGTG